MRALVACLFVGLESKGGRVSFRRRMRGSIRPIWWWARLQTRLRAPAACWCGDERDRCEGGREIAHNFRAKRGGPGRTARLLGCMVCVCVCVEAGSMRCAAHSSDDWDAVDQVERGYWVTRWSCLLVACKSRAQSIIIISPPHSVSSAIRCSSSAAETRQAPAWEIRLIDKPHTHPRTPTHSAQVWSDVSGPCLVWCVDAAVAASPPASLPPSQQAAAVSER